MDTDALLSRGDFAEWGVSVVHGGIGPGRLETVNHGVQLSGAGRYCGFHNQRASGEGAVRSDGAFAGAVAGERGVKRVSRADGSIADEFSDGYGKPA